jgi:putative lipoprotein
MRSVLVLVFALFAPLAAQAAEIALSGTVSHRERIALPPGAVLQVSLERIDAAGAPLLTAETDIAGAQVPVRFAFTADVDLAPEASYGLSAAIVEGRSVLFRTAAPVRFDPAAPAPLALLVVRAAASRPPAAAPNLVGTEWRIETIAGVPVAADPAPTLAFQPDGRAGGDTSCNIWFSQPALDGNALSFGVVGATERACAPELMEQEQRFLTALGEVAAFEIAGDTLHLSDAAGETVLTAVAQ